LQDLVSFDVNLAESGHNYGRFVIEPLEPGYGITLGNALRRILLRSLPGAAIVRVRIVDVWHEFSMIEGVREDMTEIVLNLKRVRIRPIGPLNESRAHLYHQGRGVVTAGDIDWPSDLEIINPELVIATADDPGAVIDMDLVVASGRGYVLAEEQESPLIGEIPMDALFTPIDKVNYVVEHTRVGQNTQFDRLILEIQTDGTIEPDEALSQAAGILVDHAARIAQYNRVAVEPVARVGAPVEEVDLDPRPLAEIGLSARVLNALRSRQIERVGQVLSMSADQLKTIRNFGDKSFDELVQALEANGYSVPARLRGTTDTDGMIAQESPADIEGDEETDE
jgi:DNA-directed RNA polymerase subunit alpha